MDLVTAVCFGGRQCQVVSPCNALHYCLFISCPDDGGGSFYGAFASKMGSGAAKAGKKFAQSEAGRSATRAAVKGATDAAVKDVSDRYLGGGGESSGAPPKAKPRASVASTSVPAVTRSKPDNDSDEEYERHRRDTYTDTRPPPKPSFFNRFKPNINIKRSDDSSSKPVAPRKPKKKIYKYAAIDKADWERLPTAMTLYNFRGEMKCDLEFRKGQIIHIMTKTDSTNDWWEGRIEDRVGIFPANYVKLM